jgi:hypothetical protein
MATQINCNSRRHGESRDFTHGRSVGQRLEQGFLITETAKWHSGNWEHKWLTKLAGQGGYRTCSTARAASRCLDCILPLQTHHQPCQANPPLPPPPFTSARLTLNRGHESQTPGSLWGGPRTRACVEGSCNRNSQNNNAMLDGQVRGRIRAVIACSEWMASEQASRSC